MNYQSMRCMLKMWMYDVIRRRKQKTKSKHWKRQNSRPVNRSQDQKWNGKNSDEYFLFPHHAHQEKRTRKCFNRVPSTGSEYSTKVFFESVFRLISLCSLNVKLHCCSTTSFRSHTSLLFIPWPEKKKKSWTLVPVVLHSFNGFWTTHFQTLFNINAYFFLSTFSSWAVANIVMYVYRGTVSSYYTSYRRISNCAKIYSQKKINPF